MTNGDWFGILTLSLCGILGVPIRDRNHIRLHGSCRTKFRCILRRVSVSSERRLLRSIESISRSIRPSNRTMGLETSGRSLVGGTHVCWVGGCLQ